MDSQYCIEEQIIIAVIVLYEWLIICAPGTTLTLPMCRFAEAVYISIVALKACSLQTICIAEVTTFHMSTHVSLLRSATLLTPCSSLVGVTKTAMHCIPRAHIWSVLQTMTDMPVILCFQIPIYCGSPEHRKRGIWRPIQKTVECMDQDCKDKPADERLMKYSGHASFEAHCGKNPKQYHWRRNFKVDVEGIATLVQ